MMHATDTYSKPHTTSSATYCISYGLLRASHSRNPTGKPDFVLIPVAFEIAYSLLHTLRV